MLVSREHNGGGAVRGETAIESHPDIILPRDTGRGCSGGGVVFLLVSNIGVVRGGVPNPVRGRDGRFDDEMAVRVC